MRTLFVNTIAKEEMRRQDIANGCEMIMRCGANTGNVCFVDAMRKQVIYDISINFNEIVKYNDTQSVFVIPASNWINLNGNVLKALCLPLENEKVQLAVAGIGIQTTQEINTPSKLAKALDIDSKKALKILSEHSVSIGVRGYFTAEVLDLLGIHNWKVIGCPSFYEPFRKWGENYKIKKNLEGIVCNITLGNYVGKNMEHKIIELAVKESAILIMQSLGDFPRTLFENMDIEERHILSWIPGLTISRQQLKEYMINYAKIFFCRDLWEEYLLENKISFCFGSRFHGNMMAFSSGIPALWIMQDGRTQELIEAMKLPYVNYQQLEKIESIKELYDLCEYSSDFCSHYANMCQIYKEFMRENSVGINF